MLFHISLFRVDVEKMGYGKGNLPLYLHRSTSASLRAWWLANIYRWQAGTLWTIIWSECPCILYASFQIHFFYQLSNNGCFYAKNL